MKNIRIMRKILKIIKEINWYKNRSFWIVLFLSALLWIYISLNDTYITMLDVPLSVIPPKNRAIEQVLANNISVEISGNGWNLFNYLYLNNTKRCRVNLDDVIRNDSLFTINSLHFQKGLEGINKITPRGFYPNQIVVTTGEIEDKEVDVKPNIILNIKDGFVLVGGIHTEPSSVLISGNGKSLKYIESWNTASTEFVNVNLPFSYSVNLSDTLSSIIKINTNKVKVYGDIQQYGEITFDDITLKITGGQIPNNHIISPTNFKITLTGGIEQLNKISPSDIELSIDYDKIANDTIGILIPTLKIPPFTKKMNVEPKYIQHKIRL